MLAAAVKLIQNQFFRVFQNYILGSNGAKKSRALSLSFSLKLLVLLATSIYGLNVGARPLDQIVGSPREPSLVCKIFQPPGGDSRGNRFVDPTKRLPFGGLSSLSADLQRVLAEVNRIHPLGYFAHFREDPFHQAVRFGRHFSPQVRGKPIDTSARRSVVVLNPSQHPLFYKNLTGWDGISEIDYLLVANFTHMSDSDIKEFNEYPVNEKGYVSREPNVTFYFAKIPLTKVARLSILREKFMPIAAHGMKQAEFKNDAFIELVGLVPSDLETSLSLFEQNERFINLSDSQKGSFQADPIWKSILIEKPIRLSEVYTSIDAVGDNYDLIKGTQNMYAISFRLVSPLAKITQATLSGGHPIKPFPVNLNSEHSQLAMALFLSGATFHGMSKIYHTLWENCYGYPMYLLERARPYFSRGINVREFVNAQLDKAAFVSGFYPLFAGLGSWLRGFRDYSRPTVELTNPTGENMNYYFEVRPEYRGLTFDELKDLGLRALRPVQRDER